MDASDLQAHAHDLIAYPASNPTANPPEVRLRRAISASYYALFHILTASGSNVFLSGGDALKNQVTRAYNHAAMRKVCDAYVRSPNTPFPPLLSQLNPGAPDTRLTNVARTFARLQDARHIADYDLASTISYLNVVALVALTDAALTDFQAIEAQPETVVFLTALLLADRWTRRG